MIDAVVATLAAIALFAVPAMLVAHQKNARFAETRYFWPLFAISAVVLILGILYFTVL